MANKDFLDEFFNDKEISKIRQEYFELFGKKRMFLLDYDYDKNSYIQNVKNEIKQRRLLNEIEPFLLDKNNLNLNLIALKDGVSKEIQKKFKDYICITKEIQSNMLQDVFDK